MLSAIPVCVVKLRLMRHQVMKWFSPGIEAGKALVICRAGMRCGSDRAGQCDYYLDFSGMHPPDITGIVLRGCTVAAEPLMPDSLPGIFGRICE